MTQDLDTPVDESLLRGETVEETTAEEVVEPVAEEVTQEAEAKPEPKEQRDQMIPRSRFDEVYRQAKEREEENAQLRAMLEANQKPQVQAEPQTDIKALRQQAYEAMIEGDSEKYSEISEQIDREIMARAKAEAKAEVEADLNTRETVSKLESVAADAMEKYPFLNPETGNAEAIDEVIDFRDMYISKGMAPHEALSKAVSKVAPMYAQVETKTVIVDERTPKAVERAVRAAEKQPPATSQIGIGQRGEDKVFNPANIKQSDWDGLSAEERMKLLAA